MTILKKIFGTFFMLLGLAMCGIGLFLLISEIIEDPTYVPCYVGVIFLTTVAVFILFILLPFPIPCKPKPKTFSIHLTMWLIVAIYACGLGAALLWWGFTVAERLRGLLIAFAIIVTILGGAALGGLFWQIVICLKNKFVLKHGIETEATFIDSRPTFEVHYGKEQHGTSVFQYYVKFKYRNGEKEVISKSNTMYSQAEANYFEQTGKFSVKYKGNSAVISQIPEKINKDN